MSYSRRGIVLVLASLGACGGVEEPGESHAEIPSCQMEGHWDFGYTPEDSNCADVIPQENYTGSYEIALVGEELSVVNGSGERPISGSADLEECSAQLVYQLEEPETAETYGIAVRDAEALYFGEDSAAAEGVLDIYLIEAGVTVWECHTLYSGLGFLR